MITSLHLKNFKAFADRLIPLGQFTLLSGLNGSGKSTILQALALIRQSNDTGLLSSNEWMLNGELVQLGTGRDILFHNFEQREIEISIGFGTPSPEQLNPANTWRAQVDVDADVLQCTGPSTSLGDMNLLHSGFQFLRADRITPDVTFPKSQDAIKSRQFLGPRGEYTAHYLLDKGADTISSEVLMHNSEQTAKTILSQVNAWLQEFSPGVRVEPHAVPMTDLVRLAFSFKTEAAAYDAPLRPTNVGFGLTHALPVVAACVGAKPGALIVVENPEAQLHPQGQVAIGSLLALAAAAGAQVIIETHSDHVLNGLRLAVKDGHLSAQATACHFFRRSPGRGADFDTPVIGQDGKLSYWPSGFFDQWERSLDQLIG